jgi:hypothetical protein
VINIKRNIIPLREFLGEYNELISNVAEEQNDCFGVLASPTLNKQESISYLYKNIFDCINGIKTENNKINPFIVRLKFVSALLRLFLKILLTSIRFRVKTIPKGCVYVRTWLVSKSIVKGGIRDEYFRIMIKGLSKEFKTIVGFQPLGFDNTLDLFDKAEKPKNYIIQIGLLNGIDIFNIFISYVLTAKIKIKNDYYYKGINVTKLINASLKQDYYTLGSFQAYLELSIAKKIKKLNPVCFIYNFERQAWENAYLVTLERSITRTIGYQASGFSFRFLNFFPSASDYNTSHFPDKILTVGDYFTKLLFDYGKFPIPIETFAALRFDYKHENNKYIIKNASKIIYKRILYAFSVHLGQYASIVSDLIDVFKNTEIEVHLKFHPLYEVKNIKIELPKNFKVWIDRDNCLLNEMYDVVLFNDNSFGIESLIQGVRSYEYDLNLVYDERRMIGFDLYDNKMNINKLHVLKNDLINNKLDKSLPVTQTQDYIQNMYKIYDGFTNDTFLI